MIELLLRLGADPNIKDEVRRSNRRDYYYSLLLTTTLIIEWIYCFALSFQERQSFTSKK